MELERILGPTAPLSRHLHSVSAMSAAPLRALARAAVGRSSDRSAPSRRRLPFQQMPLLVQNRQSAAANLDTIRLACALEPFHGGAHVVVVVLQPIERLRVAPDADQIRLRHLGEREVVFGVAAPRASSTSPELSRRSAAYSRIVSSMANRGSSSRPTGERGLVGRRGEPGVHCDVIGSSPQTPRRPRACTRRRTPPGARTGAARPARAGRSSSRSRRAGSAGAPARRARPPVSSGRRRSSRCEQGRRGQEPARARRPARSRAAARRAAGRSPRPPAAFVGGHGEIRPDRPRALDEQRDRLRRSQALDVRATRRPAAPAAGPVHRARPRGGAALGWSPASSRRRSCSSLRDQRRRREHVLEVVEHQQQLRGRAGARQRLGGAAADSSAAPSAVRRPSRTSPAPDRRQVDEERAVGEVVRAARPRPPPPSRVLPVPPGPVSVSSRTRSRGAAAPITAADLALAPDERRRLTQASSLAPPRGFAGAGTASSTASSGS